MPRQSVELLLDPAAEAAVLARWRALAEAGLPGQAGHPGATNRPHVTLAEAATVSPEAEQALVDRCAGLPPLATRLLAPATFGDDPDRPVTLVLPVEPTAGLLDLRADVVALLGDQARVRPDGWAPHVTLARRMPRSLLADALRVVAADAVPVRLGGVRRWDPVTRRAWVLE